MAKENTAKNKNIIKIKNFISDTLIIALLTGVGYFAAFVYQLAYLGFFGIPIFFVDVNLTAVLLMTLIGFVIILVCAPALMELYFNKPKTNLQKLNRNVGISLTFDLIIIIPFFMCGYSLFGRIAIFPLLALFVILFIAFIVKIYRKPPKLNKMEGSLNFLVQVEKLYGSYPIIFVSVIVLFICYCFAFGSFAAKIENSYLISNTNPEILLISTYNGNFIGGTFSSSTRSLDNITLISQDKISNSNIFFKNNKIGRLNSQFSLDWQELIKIISSR